MKNDIYEGPIFGLLAEYDRKEIGIDCLGEALLEEIRAGGDVAYVEPIIYEAILRANETPRTVENSYIGDALVCSLVGNSAEIRLPRPRGTFASFNKQSMWEDPKWISGCHAWKESARRRYIDTVTKREISEDTLEGIRNGSTRGIRFSDIKMVVTWEGRPSARPVDVLVWKQHDDKPELVAIHHVLFVQGEPVYSFINDMEEPDNNGLDMDAPVTVDTVVDGFKTTHTVRVFNTVFAIYESINGRFTRAS
jgi:hypothetical protein